MELTTMAETTAREADMSEALGQRLAAMGPGLYQLAVRILNNETEAEDVVQETFVQALRHLKADVSEHEQKAWLYRVVANKAKDYFRAESRRRKREAVVTAIPATASGASDEMVRALQVAMAALDQKYRVPLSLCYEQGFTKREAAAVLEMPERTVSNHVRIGLDKLRQALKQAGYVMLPAGVLGGLSQTAPAVPASLAGWVEALVAQGAVQTGTGAAASTAAAAKGGVAMKIVAGIVAAGVLAGAVAVSTGMSGGGALPAVAGGEPAPVNPHNGMQEREEVFEFTTKPAVKKEGDKWIITFASKGKCDATVAILDGQGKVIRHLASGVLGSNAPYPFQQNTLSQKLEWDGENDQGRPAPAGCKVKVSLGLTPVFERNMLWDPYAHKLGFFKQTKKKGDTTNVLVARGQDGTIYVGSFPGGGHAVAVAYGKDGKYLRTVFPPPAADVEKIMSKQGWKFTATKWGDKVLIGQRYGSFKGSVQDTRKKPVLECLADVVAAIKAQPGAGEVKVGPLPAGLQKPTSLVIKQKRGDYFMWEAALAQKMGRIAVDRTREEIYVGGQKRGLFRLDGKTGELDKSWFPDGKFSGVTECHVGPDGLLYFRVGGAFYGQWIVRVDHAGKAVDFGGEAVALPGYKLWTPGEKKYGKLAGKKIYCGLKCDGSLRGAKVLWTGEDTHSNTHARGLYVSPKGMIVAPLLFQGPATEYAAAHGIPAKPKGHASFVGVWDPSGKLLSLNALGHTSNGHGVAMDRDGNIYTAIAGMMKKGKKPDGLTSLSASSGLCGGMGTLAKFRWNGKFPLASLKPATRRSGSIDGALWTYFGLPCQTSSSCTCFNIRGDMDYWARSFIPSNHLHSVMVLDANGNRIARLGRYGNVDDTTADVKAGKDGLRFIWIKALGVSDTALYAMDFPNNRILKAALKYAVEETVPAP